MAVSLTKQTTDPREAWGVAEVAHTSTGETIGDDGTGDEWTIERRNVHYPHARVVTTYAVTRIAHDEDGNRIDPVGLDDSDVTYRYAVDEQTEMIVSTETDDDFWLGEIDGIAMQRGEGSYLDYDTEEAADRECEAMARRDAAMTGIVTWDGRRH